MEEYRVTKEEYQKFIESYPRTLVRDVCGISDPPTITHNDFTLGIWPDSVVARTWLYSNNPNDYWYTPEEKRYYYIKSNSTR